MTHSPTLILFTLIGQIKLLVFSFLIFFSCLVGLWGFFPVLLRCCSAVLVSVSTSWSEQAQLRKPGLKITPIPTAGREKLWIFPEVQCRVQFPY